MSMSHMVGDAFTYYSFLNMINDDQEVKSMIHERNHNIIEKVSKLKGNMDDDEWMFSDASNIRVGNTLGRPTAVFLYDINMDWIEREVK